MRRILLCAMLGLVACGRETVRIDSEAAASAQSQSSAPMAADHGAINAARLNALYAEYWETQLARFPLRATALGDARYHAALTDTGTAAFRAESERLERDWLARCLLVDAATLDETARLSRDIFVAERERNLNMLRYPDWQMAVNQLNNIAATMMQLGSGNRGQPFRTVADYEAWLARGQAFVPQFDTVIGNLRAGLDSGVILPRVVVEKTLAQLDGLVVANPEQSLLWQVVTRLPADTAEPDRERLQQAFRAMIGAQIGAISRLRDFLKADYLPRSRSSVGLSAVPGGAAWYAALAERFTTTKLTPQQIHELGQSEVKRLLAEMDRVRQQVGFQGDLQAFFRFMTEDAQFRFASEDDFLARYRALLPRIQPAVAAQFSLQPKAAFEVRLVEAFRAASAAPASYQQPSQDGSRPGIFYANAYDLPSRRSWEIESIFIHEAIPGHHFQIALQQELQNLPAFRRYGGETAYIEGWGLYTESLGKELGLYQDPYSWFGRLQAEIWRANRLVVDTGMHALGWTREQAIEQMRTTSAMSETNAVIEVERYIANPGQALAYKIGELKLQELKRLARERLGARFDVREFHRVVLQDGALPLDVLEAKIRRWLDQSAPTS